MGSAALGFGVLVLVMWSATGVSAQPAGTSAASIAARLQLTESGAGRWLTALGVGPGLPAVERDADGSGIVGRLRPGDRPAPAHQSASLVPVHNHPHGASLSRDHLLELSKPGGLAVVAIGHDGGIFIAARWPRYDTERFEDPQHAPVPASVTARLRVECGSRAIDQAAADTHFSHVAALALARLA